MTFSRPCRSTLNGVCAACGKTGALLGTMIFVTAAARFGQETVMIVCGVVSLSGMVITLLCVSERVGQTETKEEFRSLERRFSQVPMKVVLSAPSLVDYFAED